MALSKHQEERLAELKRQRAELDEYKTSFRSEFGPSDKELLDTLENYIHEHGHVEIDLESLSGNFTSDDNDCGGSLREMLADMMEVKK